MSKCYSKFMHGIAASAAMFMAAGAFAQCDFTSPGDFTDTRFDSGAACGDGLDENGGWNEAAPYPFLEAGSHTVGDLFRVVGIVGTYDSNCTGTDTSRDLDWIRFSVDQSCYVTVTLSMATSDNVPIDGNNTLDLLFIEQGSDPDTATDLYGAYSSDVCPHVAVYTFANGVTQARFPVTGPDDIVVVVTTPFAPADDNLLYHGPMPYGVDVSISGYDNAACTTASDDCITVHGTGGCSDGPCCDIVCGVNFACCDTAWDASCVQDGVDQCGNFIYSCDTPWVGASNDCVGSAELVLGMPALVSFDCTEATTDGPNDVARLCSSSTSRDLWYIVGPTPYDGELLVTLCGQGNVGDAVVSMYDLGDSADIGNPQDLPSKYVACRDDDCDDDGDGNVDLAGPAGINLIGVPANDYILVRVGRFLDTDDPTALGFTGSMQISYRAVFVNHGLQSVTNNAGSNVNLGLISGDAGGANVKRWSFVPFTMPTSGTVDGFDFAAFDNTGPDEVRWKVIFRNTGDATFGDNARPFSASGLYSEGSVIASGGELFDIGAPSNVGDDFQQRYFIDISNPFPLDPGTYYFTCYGAYSDGSAGGNFAWLLYGRTSELQVTSAATHIGGVGEVEGASATSSGAWPAGTPFGWRGINGGPTMAFYQLGSDYSVQAGDDPGLLYQCAFNLKGQLAAACFGDLDGSGEVDSGDVGFALLDFGPCPGCVTDLDGSGEVDSGDIGLILLSYGPCM